MQPDSRPDLPAHGCAEQGGIGAVAGHEDARIDAKPELGQIDIAASGTALEHHPEDACSEMVGTEEARCRQASFPFLVAAESFRQAVPTDAAPECAGVGVDHHHSKLDGSR